MEFGYEYGNAYCAHLLGKFAHKMDFGLEHANFSWPECDVPMSALASNGWQRFWVLEIHAVQDPAIGRYLVSAPCLSFGHNRSVLNTMRVHQPHCLARH